MKLLVASLGYAVVIVGLFLPWASVEFAGVGELGQNASIEEIGSLITIVGALAAFPLSGSRDPRAAGFVFIVFGLLFSGLALWAFIGIRNADLSFAEGFIENLQPGSGLLATFAGGILIVIAGIAFALSRTYGPPLPRSDSDNQVPAGWYPNPDGSRTLRFWTGAEWTAHRVLYGRPDS
jgi:Protein of unknown function (DUF2510)